MTLNTTKQKRGVNHPDTGAAQISDWWMYRGLANQAV